MCTSSVSEAEFHRVADATMDDLCEYLDEVAERDAADADDIDVSNSVRVRACREHERCAGLHAARLLTRAMQEMLCMCCGVPHVVSHS